MKQFFGAFFGSIVGIVIATVLAIVITIAMVKSSFNDAFSEKEEVSAVKANTVLKLVLDGEIEERERPDPFKDFGGSSPFADAGSLGLSDLVKKLEVASQDSNIKGIYLEIKSLRGGFASMLELRDAIESFKTKGKFVYVYSENYSQNEYFLASAATKIFLNPQGNLDWKGLSMNLLFYRQMFEKLDMEMQIFRHGKFKSAVEPFMLDKMSEANRYQSETFLNSIWATMLEKISKSRKLSIDELNAMANNLQIQFPGDALGKFVDALAYEDEVITELKKKVGLKESDKMKFKDLLKYEKKSETEKSAQDQKIAVIYANGAIGGGEGNDDEVGSDRLVKAIRDARLNDKVKGIVLRVNSPGGSALASDVIWREVTLAKKVKPTVVSMGNLAASGGYYISCAADRIFAQPNTITGSIGVFGVLPNIKGLLEKKLGITVDTVNTNKYSDVASGLRSVSEKEYTYIQNSVEQVYATFAKRVAEGRGISEAMVDSIGQGRVWTGTEALKIKLVDELGGLDDALAYVAQKAKIKEYKILDLPEQKSTFDDLFGKKESEFESKMMQHQLGPLYNYFRQVKHMMSMTGVQARLPFEMSFE